MAVAQALRVGIAVAVDAADQNAVLQFLEIKSRPAVIDHTRSQPAGEQGLGAFDRHGKPDILRVLVNGDVDADELAVGVQQRTARVARIHRRVGLQNVAVHHLAVITGLAVFGRQDADRDGVGEAEWIAEGDHRLAEKQVVVLGKRHRRQRHFGIDFDQGEIVELVAGQHPRLVGGLVGQHHADARRAFDYVVVRQNIAIRADDHPRTKRMFRLVTRRGGGRPEEILKEEVEHIAPVPHARIGIHPAHHAFRADIHHRRHHLFHRFHHRSPARGRRGHQRCRQKNRRNKPYKFHIDKGLRNKLSGRGQAACRGYYRRRADRVKRPSRVPAVMISMVKCVQSLDSLVMALYRHWTGGA